MVAERKRRRPSPNPSATVLRMPRRLSACPGRNGGNFTAWAGYRRLSTLGRESPFGSSKSFKSGPRPRCQTARRGKSSREQRTDLHDMQVNCKLESMGRKRVKLSEQIRQAIRDSGRTRREISEAAKVSESLMSRFMSGDSWFSEKYLDRIADVLNLNLQSIKRQRRGKS